MKIWGKNVPGERNSEFKGWDVGVSLAWQGQWEQRKCDRRRGRIGRQQPGRTGAGSRY